MLYLKKWMTGRTALTCGLCAALLVPVEAYSQALEEIVVTVRRVTESVQDVPVAVTVINAEMLNDLRVESVGDILNVTPGAQATGNRPDGQSMAIRGVQSDFESASGDAAVVVMIDNAVVSRSFMRPGAMFDVGSVEVARGPQGTSFGRNAIAGVVHFQHMRPILGQSETSLGLDVGNYNTLISTAVFNRDMGADTAGRLSLYASQRDGYFSDEITGRSYGDRDTLALRGQLLHEFGSGSELLLRVGYSKESNDNPFLSEINDPSQPAIYPASPGLQALYAGQGFAPRVYEALDNNPRTVRVQEQLPEHWDRTLFNAGVELYRPLANDIALNWTANYMSGKGDAAGNQWGIDFISYYQILIQDSDSFQTEIRFDNFQSADPLHWVTGFYYLNETVGRNDSKVIELGMPAQTFHDYMQTNRTRSYGLFGDITYDITDSTVVSVGARYTYDEKDYIVDFLSCSNGTYLEGIAPANVSNLSGRYTPAAPGVFCGAFLQAGSPLLFTVDESDSWSDFSYRGSITQRLNDDNNVYLSYATAFKSGVFPVEPNSPSAGALLGADPEGVRTLELGFKGNFVDGRFNYDVAVFRSDFVDRQDESLDTDTGQTVVENIEKAVIQGIELGLNIYATENLRFMLNGSYLDHEDKETGEKLSGVQDWGAYFATVYEMPMASGAAVRLRADMRARGDRRVGSIPPLTIESETIYGASATWISPSQDLSVGVYGRNLTNEHDIQGLFPRTVIGSQGARTAGAPRTFGMSIRYDF